MSRNLSLPAVCRLETLGLALLVGCVSSPPPVPGTGSTPPHDDDLVESPQVIATADAVWTAWGSVDAEGRAEILVERRGAAPVLVSSGARTAVAGRQVGPRLAAGARGELLVTWVDRARDPEGDVLLAVSRNGGATFDAPVRVNDDSPGHGQEYQDVTVLPDGTVLVVWLDERAAARGLENEKQVVLGRSTDGGRSFEPNRALTSSPAGVCPCCRPSVVADARGGVHVIYRDRVGDDLFVKVISSANGGVSFGSPETLSLNPWRYPACPTDAPAIAVDARGGLRAAWMDGSSGAPCLWTAEREAGAFLPARFLGARDSRPSAPVPASFLPLLRPGCCPGGGSEDPPGRPAVAFLGGGELAAAWEDSAGRIWLLGPGESRQPRLVAGSDEVSARGPSLAARGDSLQAVWVESRFLDAEGGAPPRLVTRLARREWRLSGGELAEIVPAENPGPGPANQLQWEPVSP